MRKTIKAGLFTSVAVSTALYSKVFAAINPSQTTINDGIVGNSNTADVVIQDWISTVMGYLTLAAIVFGLWGGFNILTAAGDEEKVKKGKTIIIQAALGIVVIFIAASIVGWVINIVTGGSTN